MTIALVVRGGLNIEIETALMHKNKTLTISVIIPVHYGGDHFRKCLTNMASADPPPGEVIVVADGDTDGTWRLAEEFGFHVERMPVSGGPARARNLGANHAKGDILFFVDADVTIPQKAVEQVVEAFQSDPELSAIIGSYDDAPAEANFLSQYKNLLHHYVHQTSNEDASTFWTGCGAIRREIFLKLGGFDETYRHPSIEDIELGYRLKEAGFRIRLVKMLQVKHLKHWGIFSLIRADFFYRALPWTRLILRKDRLIDDLNLKISQRISVALVYLLLLALFTALFVPGIIVLSLLSMVILVIINFDLYYFFKRKRGLRFAVKTIPWHWFYFFYSGLAFSIGYAGYQLKRLVD